MTDFNALLDQRVGEVEAPKLMPMGTYTWEVTKRAFGKSTQKKTDYVEFTYKCLGFEDDVTQDDLPENWQGREMKETFYITPDALKRLEEHLKLYEGTEGLGLREAIEYVASGGKYIKGHLNHRPYQNRNSEDRIAVEFDAFAKAE